MNANIILETVQPPTQIYFQVLSDNDNNSNVITLCISGFLSGDDNKLDQWGSLLHSCQGTVLGLHWNCSEAKDFFSMVQNLIPQLLGKLNIVGVALNAVGFIQHNINNLYEQEYNELLIHGKLCSEFKIEPKVNNFSENIDEITSSRLRISNIRKYLLYHQIHMKKLTKKLKGQESTQHIQLQVISYLEIDKLISYVIHQEVLQYWNAQKNQIDYLKKTKNNLLMKYQLWEGLLTFINYRKEDGMQQQEEFIIFIQKKIRYQIFYQQWQKSSILLVDQSQFIQDISIGYSIIIFNFYVVCTFELINYQKNKPLF